MPEARRSFVPVLLPGVAATALAAVCCAKAWAELGAAAARNVPIGAPGLASAGQVPLASALSLVSLAAWGALLVTRGRVRRLFAGLGLLSSLVLLVVTIAAARTAPRALRHALDTQFALPRGSSAHADITLTGWYWVAAVAVVLSTAAFALAVRYAPAWPAMAAKYDAPGAAPTPAEPRTSQEIWKALDEGHDPTE